MPNAGESQDGTVRRRTVLSAGGAALGLGILGAGAAGPAAARSGDAHRFLFQNLWMLNGILGNDVDVAKPALDERAREFGQRLRGSDIDIAGLCEVFASRQREGIREPVERAVDDEIGPPADFEKSSGLYTLGLGGPEIVARERYEFEADGYQPRDADAWANKGLLFTRVEIGGGAVDVFTTHLIAGGGLPFEDWNPWWDPPSPADYRADQLAELESFVRSTKDEYDPDRAVPTIVAGDFNVAAGTEQYGALTEVRDRLGLYDAWERYGSGAGPTDRTGVTSCPFDPDASPPSYCRDAGEGERIDYVFVDEADRLSVEGIRRRVFWREEASPGQFFADDDEAVPNYLADHVGLELEFTLS